MKYIYDSHRILTHFAINHGFESVHVINSFKERTGKGMKRVISKPGKISNNILAHRKIVHDFQAWYYQTYFIKDKNLGTN